MSASASTITAPIIEQAYECLVVERDAVSPEIIGAVTTELAEMLLTRLANLERAANWETFTLTIEDRPAPAIAPAPSPYVTFRGTVTLL